MGKEITTWIVTVIGQSGRQKGYLCHLTWVTFAPYFLGLIMCYGINLDLVKNFSPPDKILVEDEVGLLSKLIF